MCRRCGARLHPRKPASVARTSALLISAYLLYIPANVLPVMETGSLFGAQTDTIMSGVVFLVVTGSWPLAALIFFASIVVPLAKLAALTVLTVSVQRRATWAPERRARIFRIVAFVNRWRRYAVKPSAVPR
jgi:paraquat-inducible protein A